MTKVYTIEEDWSKNLKPNTVDVLEKSLDKGISSISGALFSQKQFSEAYTLCYDMCEQKGKNSLLEQLYNAHTNTIQRYLTQNVLPSIQKRCSADPTKLLEEVKFRWDNHITMNKWYARFFSPVNRFYAENYKVPTLTEKSLNIFKTDLYVHIRSSAKDAILSLIEKERDGEIINKTLVKSTVRIYEEMGMGKLHVYESDLESELLASTREYYSKKREEMLSGNSTSEYLVKAKHILINEENRANYYFNPTTKPKLLECIDDEILSKPYDALIKDKTSGCAVLLANDKFDGLRLMFKLFQRIGNDGLESMAKIFESHIKSEGNVELNKRQERIEGKGKDKPHDPVFVNNLFVLHQKYSDLVKKDFGNHPAFDISIKNSFEDFLNEKVGEYKNLVILSTFCDTLLKKVDNDLEESLEKITQLFLYLNEKDRFVDTYRDQLAKRLLSHNPPDADHEKIMITKLKTHCGTEFTSKLEGMLNDFDVGKDIKTEFDKTYQATKSQVDFAVQVISPNHWPAHEILDVTIPSEISEKCIDVFTAWHDQKHNQRNLKWIHSLGSVTMKATYGKRKYTLEMTPLQAVALNALDNGTSMSYTELKEVLNLEDDILKPVLGSLSSGKYKLLSKSPNNKKISENDTFIANSKFRNDKLKIRVPIVSFTKSGNTKSVEGARKLVIQAAIVRIMKARKTLKHTQLVAEVLHQLVFFKSNTRDIKKNIQSLVDTEYLERTEDGQGYNYLA